jgi:hypothetical protein
LSAVVEKAQPAPPECRGGDGEPPCGLFAKLACAPWMWLEAGECRSSRMLHCSWRPSFTQAAVVYALEHLLYAASGDL